jgi:hypothetical protein
MRTFSAAKSLSMAFAALFILLICTSCERERQRDRDKLTAHPWRMVKYLVLNVDSLPYFDSCNYDDRFTFLSDNTYTLHDGQVACSGQAPTVIASGKWEITKSFSLKLTDDVTQETIPYNVEKLSADSLKLSAIFFGEGRVSVYAAY